MHTKQSNLSRVVAGLVIARCSCCVEPRTLELHRELDATRLYCPETSMVYLDRGDGLFEPTSDHLDTDVQGGQEPDVVSDRPRRTDAKERISLERATFA